MQTQTLLDAYQDFSSTEACQSSRRLLDNLRTTLRRYVLPRYGFSTKELRNDLETCLDQIPLNKFLEDAEPVLEIFHPSLENSPAHRIAAATLNTYRSTLLRFFNWLYIQNSSNIPISSHDVEKVTPMIYSGVTLSKARRGGRNIQVRPYALKADELNLQLQQQLGQLRDFLTSHRVTERDFISGLTFESYRESILCILGWQKNLQGQLSEQLRLEQLSDLDTIKAFVEWGMQERKNSYGWAINMIQAVLAVTRWLAFTQGDSQSDHTSKEIHNYLQTLRIYNRQTVTSDREMVSLTVDESVQVVNYLKQCCAPQHSSGAPRSNSAIIKSWQRYLIVALLVYSPLRQREIRELRWDDSLIREPETYRIQFDTDKAERTNFLLSRHLTPDLDRWRSEFRSEISSDTNLVFTRLGSGRTRESIGKPLSSRDISDLVSAAVYKATSVLFNTPKRATPQSFQHASVALMAQGIEP